MQLRTTNQKQNQQPTHLASVPYDEDHHAILPLSILACIKHHTRQRIFNQTRHIHETQYYQNAIYNQ